MVNPWRNLVRRSVLKGDDMTNRLDKQTATGLEQDLASAYSHLVNISNALYRVAPDHPLLDDLTTVIGYVESVPTEELYADYEPTGATT